MTSYVPPFVPASALSTSDKVLIILSHLSSLLSVGILLPLIVLLVKKNESDIVAAHAEEALNFHLSLLIYAFCLIPLLFVFFIGFFFMIVLAIVGLILAIVAAVKASNGEFYRYPITTRLVR